MPRYLWRMLREMTVNWQLMVLVVPVGLELIRQTVGARFHCGCSTFRALITR